MPAEGAVAPAWEGRRWGRLLWLPAILSLVLLVLPQADFVWMSFHEDLGMGQVSAVPSLDNYRAILSDPFYLRAIWLTVYLPAEATVIGLLLGFPTAYALARLGNLVTTLALSLILTTSLITIVIKLLGLDIVLGASGLVNAILASLGLDPVQFLDNELGVVIGLVQYTLPLLTLLLFGVVQTIPAALEEAAEIHGATRAAIFARVILPLAMPGIVGGGLIAFNMSMGAFTSPVLLGGGRVLTMPVLIQQKIIQNSDYATGAALSTVLLVLVFLANLAIGIGVARYAGPRRRRRS